MTSIIFVHGTGGRKEAYDQTFQQIKQALQERRPDIKLVPCLWGDPVGAKLNKGGVSIPSYDETDGGMKRSPEEENIQLWEALYKDPSYEMRLLGLRSLQSQTSAPGKQTSAQELKAE